jgi:hypothetical protein
LYANNLREPQVHEEKIWYKVHEKDELGRTVLHYIAGGLTDNRGAYYEGASNVAFRRTRPSWKSWTTAAWSAAFVVRP